MLGDYDTHAALPVADLERAKQFYGGTLGFTADLDTPFGVFYRSGSTRFFVFPSTGRASGTATQMGWQASDFDKTVEDLRSRGVTFEEYSSPPVVTENGVATFGDIKSVWFKDPDGNLLSIVSPIG